MSDEGVRPGDRLEQAARVRREADGLRSQLEAAEQLADAATARVQEARDALAAEDRDVERLESLSWSRILSSLKGHQGSDHDREVAERDAARYVLADAQARDDLAWREVESLQARLDALGDVETLWQAALDDQEEWAARHDPATTAKVAETSRRRGELLAEDAEGREAHAAGMVAREHLRGALSLLGDARSWSSWDTFGGGGLFTDLMKYDRLDDVARALKDCDVALERFSRELADLDLSGVEAVHLDRLTQAFDVFFDNFFTDLAVRSRIRDAEDRVGQVLATVEATLNGLTRRGHEIAAELEQLAARREEVLAGHDVHLDTPVRGAFRDERRRRSSSGPLRQVREP